MADFPALPLWTDAYLSDCGHLSDAQHGRYLLILFAIWRAPNCRIPNNNAWLAHKFNRSQEAVDNEIWPVIREFCNVGPRWITQKRLSQERRFVAVKSRKNSLAAKARWQKEKEECERIANAMPKSCERNAPTPTPIKKQENKKAVLNGNGVTVRDPHERLARFAGKIAQYISDRTHSDQGSNIVLAAMDATHPDHAQALTACQSAAVAMHKGWPRNWPTDGKFFEAQHGEG